MSDRRHPGGPASRTPLRRALSLLLLLVLPVPGLFGLPPGVSVSPLPPRALQPEGTALFTLVSADESGLNQPNLYDDPRMWGDRFREYTLGALETGLAVADFDRDGLHDIFAVSRNGPCALYRQSVPGRFYDVARAAGVAIADDPAGKTGATAVDINQDGWPDLYVCRLDAPNLLFLNNGDGTFTEEAEARGLAIHDASVHAVFADYDGDGDLDAYLVTNILDFARSPTGRPDRLLRNEGDGTFQDVSDASGIWGRTQGHTAIWFDANRDGWPDLYVANDFETPDRFYLNRGDGTFVDLIDERLPHVTYFSMGADSGDLNNDGHLDFIVADMRDRTRREFIIGMEEAGRGLWQMERTSALIPQYMWNAVYLGTGTARYEEAAHLTGMVATGWTWSTRILDLDGDGRNDVFFTNGMLRNFVDADLLDRQNTAPTLAARAAVWRDAPVRAEPNLAFRNRGDLRFDDVSREWGLDQVGVSFGCAAVDLDRDGDLDLVWVNQDGPPTLARNNSSAGNRVVIRLNGRPPNREAVGAELVLESASGTQIRQLYPERGIVSSEPGEAVFGLGHDPQIQRLTVRWPDGSVQVFPELPVNVTLTLDPPEQKGRREPARTSEDPAGSLLVERATTRGLDFTSTAEPVEELARQLLLPRRLGFTAPALASGDVNRDGLADLYVSGARGQAGRLFVGQTDGGFATAADQPWAANPEADETGALFLDANGDGAADLYVAVSQVESPEPGAAGPEDRLYLGDGSGGFRAADNEETQPRAGANTAALAAADFDGDGRTDLFVGNRSLPGRWPASGPSFLYRQTPEGLVDATDSVAPALREAGLVTGAAWADLDADGEPDLVLSVEWGPVRVFRNNGSRLTEVTRELGLADHTGWWRCVAVTDLNRDGRPDLVAGNLGLNTRYRASPEQPAVLFAGSLGGLNEWEILEAAYDDDGRLYPLKGRSRLSYAFPKLRRQFPTFSAYARATVETIFTHETLASAQRFEANTLASGVFFQQTDGTFRFSALPTAAQLAPINDLGLGDINGDGELDLVLVGNDFGPEPSTGRFDGSVGRILLGDGQGGFRVLSPAESGFLAPGDTRSVTLLPPAGPGLEPRIVTATARGSVRLFESRQAGSP